MEAWKHENMRLYRNTAAKKRRSDGMKQWRAKVVKERKDHGKVNGGTKE